MAGQKKAKAGMMMGEERLNKDTKRMYFGGLFDCVSESEIRQRLCKYGEISNVQIIQRRGESGEILKTFAYVDINASTEAISKCFSEYNKCRWKGHEIKIQLAKESYEKRLQREWQEVKNIQTEVPVTTERQKELYDKMEEAVLKTKHITPGSKIKDKTNWVIGKYGRPLPVVYLRSKGSKVHKFDPSKHCHQLKKIKSLENESENDRIGDLTWTIPGDRKIKKPRKLRKSRTANSFEVVENEAENDRIGFLTRNIPGNEETKKSKRRRKSSETETSFEVNEADHDQMRSLTIPGSERNKQSKHACKSNKTDNSVDTVEGDSVRVQEGVHERRDRDAIGKREDEDEDSDCSMESSDAESIENNIKLSDSIISQIRNNKNENETITRTTSSFDNDSKTSFHGNEIDFDVLRRNKSLMESFSNFLRSSKLPLEKSNASDKMAISKCGNLDSDKTDKVDSSYTEVASDDDSSSSGDEDSDNNDDKDAPVMQGDKDTLIRNFEVDLSTSSEDSEDLDMERDNVEDIIREGKGSFENRDSTDSEMNSASGSEDNKDLDMESNNREDIIQEGKRSFKNEDSNDSEATSGSSSVGSEDQEVESNNEKHGSKEAFNICNGNKTEEGMPKSLSARTLLSSTRHRLANDVKAGKGVVSDKSFEVHSPSNASLKDSPKKKSSEEKRLGSLMEKSVKERKEKEIVKAALKNVDPQRNDQKHIKFGSLDDTESADSEKNEPGTAVSNKDTSTEKITGKAALSWLGLSSSEEEDSEDDEGERFEIRSQFEGPTGQKLLKLQQRVGLDERFKIDERFLDDEQVQESSETETAPANGVSTNLGDVEGERSRALSILDQLLGTKSSQKNSRKTPQDHKADAYQEPVRYDPLNKEHSQYTVADDLSSDSADEEADGKVTRETESKEKPQPEVSKEAFFDVTPSLKNLFGNQTASPFTFLSDPMEESSVADQPSSTDAKAPSVIKRPKPARLSSDEEDIHDDYLEDTDKKTQSEKIEAVPVSVSQRFFFTPSDPRLASDTIDGPSAFMRKLPLEELERILDETRENIRQNFKKKHKDSLRRRRKRDANFARL